MKKNVLKKCMLTAVTLVAAAIGFVSCNTEEVDPNVASIKVDKTIIDAPKGGGDIELAITSNRPWKLTTTPSEIDWMIPSSNSGNGDATISLSFGPNTGATREATIRIATTSGVSYVDVRVSQEGAIATESLYSDDFGTTAVQNASNQWPLISEYDGWNISGTGSANVTYSSEGGAVSARNNSTSSGYDGASGSVNVMMAAVGASFIVNDIDPLGMEHMSFSFGSNETNTTLKLFYSVDGTTWTPVDYEKITTTWGLVQVSFDIPTGSTKLHLKFTAAATQYGTRIDDLKLVGSGGSGGNSLTLSTYTSTPTADGGTYTVAVTSNTEWVVTPDAANAWCSVTPLSGTNNGILTLTVPANTGDARTAVITVKTTDNSVTRQLTVTQAGIGGGGDGTHDNPFTVAEAIDNQGAAGNTDYKWVKGYIIGTVEGTPNAANFAGPYTSQTNVILAATASETNWDNCLNIQLPTEANAPGIRSALNLVDHPENKGKEVLLEGTLESYFTPRAGLKNTRAYEWISSTGSTLNLSESAITVPATQGTKTVTLTSNTSWVVTPDAANQWCTVTPTSGSNAGTLTIGYPAYTGTATRSATITVKTTDAAVTRTLVVTQTGVETPVTTLTEDWETGTNNGTAALNGWVDAKVLGDRDWQTKEFSGNKYAQASAHNGAASDYEYWLISPALDLTNATNKIMTFVTAAGYFQATSSLEVYILDAKTPSANKTKLNPRIVNSSDPVNPTYTDWIPSGNVDLSAYTGVKYIGFRYVAKGGANNSTTYQLDNFKFGVGGDTKTLTVNPTSLSFAATGENKTFAITSNTTWNVSVESAATAWCKVNTASGSNDATITVTADPNSGGARNATITVSGTGVTSKTVAISQAAGSSGSTLSVSPGSLSFAATSAPAQTVTITSNTAWTATSSGTWCKVNGNGTANGNNNGTIAVTVTDNTGGARNATIIVSGTGATAQTVTVSQAAGSSGGPITLANISLSGYTGTSIPGLEVSGSDGSKVERIRGTGSATFTDLSYTASNSSIYTSGWTNDDAAWVITSIAAPSDIEGTINVTYKAWGTNTSPKNWKVQYSNNGTTWYDGATYDLTATANTEVTYQITIPAANKISTGGKLYIRMLPSSTVSINNAAVADGGNSRLGTAIVVTKE